MWIDEYRHAKGMELDDFARAVNAYGRKMTPPLICTITDTLIHMLERDKNCVTHPLIANAIAEYCGATPQQRDMIVAPVHKGTWEPNMGAEYAKPVKLTYNNVRCGAKPVVKINMNGDVVAAYESVVDARRREPHNEDFIRKRCQRKVEMDFTVDFPFTYRFQDDWMAMSRDEQMKDITRNGEVLV